MTDDPPTSPTGTGPMHHNLSNDCQKTADMAQDEISMPKSDIESPMQLP